jgi:uncharacterized protein DUF4260
MIDDSGCVKGGVRVLLQVEAAFILAAMLAAYWWLHANWIVFIVLLLTPDLAMLGYLRDTRIGAWVYNAFHTALGPFILAAAGALFVHALLPFAVIWAAHIAMDRTLGYGLKYDDAFGHTHLGIIGKTRGT